MISILNPDQSLKNKENSHHKILVLGLDGSGKTTLINYLRDGKFRSVRRTHGLEVSYLLLEDKHTLQIMDLGGMKAFQLTLWQGALLEPENICLILYVVDSTASDRFCDDQSAFTLIIENQALNSVPVLVLANKIDLVNVNSAGSLGLSLDLIEMKLKYPDREISLIPLSSKTGENIDIVIEWIYRVVSAHTHNK